MRYQLRKIFTLRPEQLPNFETAPDDWADNALSNFFAWASLNFLGPWCSTPEHWTSGLTRYLFTSCPCCLIFRGITIGLIVGLLPSFVIILLAAIL